MPTYLAAPRRYSEALRFASAVAVVRVQGITAETCLDNSDDAPVIVLLEVEVAQTLHGELDARFGLPLLANSDLLRQLQSCGKILLALVADPLFGASCADGAPPLLVDGKLLHAPNGIVRVDIDVASITDVSKLLKALRKERERAEKTLPEMEQGGLLRRTTIRERPPTTEVGAAALARALELQRAWSSRGRAIAQAPQEAWVFPEKPTSFPSG